MGHTDGDVKTETGNVAPEGHQQTRTMSDEISGLGFSTGGVRVL